MKKANSKAEKQQPAGPESIARLMDDIREIYLAIPKYITTPIDVLGTRLMDLLGGLAIRVSMIDGRIDPAEINLIADHFVTDWGFDRAYVTSALDWLVSRADGMRVKALAAELAQFQASNPDCNASAMQAELMGFLRELIQSDGVIDEREELALEAIDRVFSKERAFTLEKTGNSIRNLSGDIVDGASVARRQPTPLLWRRRAGRESCSGQASGSPAGARTARPPESRGWIARRPAARRQKPKVRFRNTPTETSSSSLL